MDDMQKDQILAHVDRAAMLDLAKRLISIPSFKPNETPVAHFLDGYFRGKGYEVELQEVEPGRFQAIATLKGSGGGRSLMLNGHTDINSLRRGAKRDPTVPIVEGDRLYGQGVENMKGGLASMIAAAEAVRLSPVELRGDLVLACVVGETQGGEGTKFLMECGLRTDLAVSPEPTGVGNIATVHAGIAHLAIHTYGVTGHISVQEHTINAVSKMTKVINALESMKFTHIPSAKLPAMPRINVGSIIGGRGESYVLIEPPYVPDLCTILIDVHFVPGQTLDTIIADFRNVLDPLAAEDSELRYEIEVPPPASFEGRRRLVMEPFDLPDGQEIVDIVTRSHAAVTGMPPQAVGPIYPFSYSAGDVTWLWKAGIPCLEYGPSGGFNSAEGEDNFWTSISEMETCAKVMALIALDVCG